ncbi:MAG: 1-deoxy-D-xylulose-5-phosphate reductoisomerase [Eubacteriales bacterium]|nr:1-deoxy-D-xylulose-5-phosphate reductoisomerase [Eubacteriales bacterium]
MKRKISLLGATGSIGQQTLAVAAEHPDIDIVSMGCHSDVAAMETAARRVQPQTVNVYRPSAYREMCERLADTNIQVTAGMDGMKAMVADDAVDMVVSGISGMIGIEPTLAALTAGKDIALANKETLVAAGDIVLATARCNGVIIYPVDSEHSAIFQCLHGRTDEEIESLILTASGGPFRCWTAKMLEHVTPEQALRHPNWSMGPKITVDSATLMNKGLEIIEAAKLFNMPEERIEVLVHPQSIIHSMVRFRDGAIMAQLGPGTMTGPIQYAIYRGVRHPLSMKRLDFAAMAKLTFETPDTKTFPALHLARTALRTGGTMPAVLNAANEIAVARFLAGRIAFPEIVATVERVMAAHRVGSAETLTDIMDAVRWVEEELGEKV